MINDFLVIFDDEDVIGKVEEIRKYFLNELAIKLYTDDIEITEKINLLNMIQELISKLENENDKSIIKVSYNPMGCFNIFHLEWENKEIKEGKKQEQKQCYTYEDKLRVKAEEGLEELKDYIYAHTRLSFEIEELEDENIVDVSVYIVDEDYISEFLIGFEFKDEELIREF